MARTMTSDNWGNAGYPLLLPGDALTYDDGQFMMVNEDGRLARDSILFVLDLSPLSRFIQAGKGKTPPAFVTYGIGVGGGIQGVMVVKGGTVKTGDVVTIDLSRGKRVHQVNGIWVDFDLTPPEPEPKSPQDRALDDFIEKRKAKREYDGGQTEAETWKAHDEYMKKDRQSIDLDRAMSKLSFHSLTIGERLSAYKGPVL